MTSSRRRQVGCAVCTTPSAPNSSWCWPLSAVAPLEGAASIRVLDACLPHAGFKEWHQIYTLYHYLNHCNLFGGGYAGSAENILRSLTRKF